MALLSLSLGELFRVIVHWIQMTLNFMYRYGIEGIVHTHPQGSEASVMTFDPDNDTLTCPTTGHVVRLFGKVQVRVVVEEAGHAAAQRSKLVLRLVEPQVPGLSVDPLPGGGDAPAKVEVAKEAGADASVKRPAGNEGKGKNAKKKK
jgi:hypothetical protein